MNEPYASYQGLVYLVLYKLNVRKPHEDYLQEAFFIYDECKKSFDPSRANFSTYFTNRLIFYFKSLFRKQKFQSSRLSSLCRYDGSYSPDPIMDWLFFHDIFHYCCLNEFEKNVLRLSLQGCTVGQIAAAEAVSPATVKRARKAIREKTRHRLRP
ncbi:RNA polymerase sigma factor [Halobacillus naozhouensis]|uniref:RNA polymerase sigma factor SigS n=1 Tax=Halobacillus naozhouensis TaxID=554880 RepID=A0ABY8IVJ4_9BACI|nr:sigma-70 family RNA polymerase sigma factor [Halobacillus naozhouensis]WFT74222.1 sigma-70 family RNA polymerase sigma factor [Halobacillus naozhouensis]